MTGRDRSDSELPSAAEQHGSSERQLQEGQHFEANLRPEHYQAGADRSREAQEHAKVGATQHTIGDTMDILLGKNDPMSKERLKLVLSVAQLDHDVALAHGVPSAFSAAQREQMQAKMAQEADRYQDPRSKQVFIKAAQLLA